MNTNPLFRIALFAVAALFVMTACQRPTTDASSSTNEPAHVATPPAAEKAAFEMNAKETEAYAQAARDADDAVESPGKLPQYASPLAMLIAQGDYTGPVNCLKAVDGDAGHLQICFDFLLHDNKASIPQRRRSSFIHVAMQVFAMTDADQIKISCAPMGTKNGSTADGILEEYMETVTVTRKNADKVMQKYLPDTDYDGLMERQGPYWTTTEAMDKLMIKEDSLVYLDLVK